MSYVIRSARLMSLFAFFYLVAMASCFSQSQRLSIQGLPPELPIEIGGNAWFLFLDGTIDTDAPRRFEEYLKANGIPDRSHVYLNSPGGSLVAGIKIGRLIRKHGLSTNIGTRLSSAKK